MSYYPPIPFIETFSIRKCREDLPCIRCGKIIKKNDLRVSLNRSRFFCFHFECFEKEYGRSIKEIKGAPRSE